MEISLRSGLTGNYIEGHAVAAQGGQGLQAGRENGARQRHRNNQEASERMWLLGT